VAVICQRAQEHIHAGECILTYGYSKIVEQFLKAAGAKRKFQVRVGVVLLMGRVLCCRWCQFPLNSLRSVRAVSSDFSCIFFLLNCALSPSLIHCNELV
jgi:hypothetical protein